jgi:Txe/YoeB family toxin of Txe-Axe toxin-antitoxin module
MVNFRMDSDMKANLEKPCKSMGELRILADTGQKTLKRINKLLKDIERNGYERIGKPEPLTGDYSGLW